jgi:hypothetical protein
VLIKELKNGSIGSPPDRDFRRDLMTFLSHSRPAISFEIQTQHPGCLAPLPNSRWVHLKLELRVADSQTLFGDGQEGSYLVPDAQF